MAWANQDKTAIVGIGATDYYVRGKSWPRTINDMAAEAIMNAHPYDYWRPGGSAQPWTPEVVALLDRATRLAPDHPGAHHYRIHLYEASTTPERALASADRIGALAPAVGHLVHMPSHIFTRVGHWQASIESNTASANAAMKEYVARAENMADAGVAFHNAGDAP